MATPIRQLLSQTSYNGDGSTTVWDFSFAGGYIDKAHVKASKLVKATGVVTQIPVILANFVGAYQLSIVPAIPVGTELTVYRDTPKDEPLVNFADKAALTEAALDLNAKQAIFVAAESSDGLATAIDSVSQITAYTDLALTYKNAAGAYADAAYSAAVTAQGARDTVVSSAAQVALDTASALASKNAASTSASNASGSASAAAGSASAASGSASGANTSAGNAATSASNANSSAINASTSADSAGTAAVAAVVAKNAAELALDSFDDRYLGAKASAPTLDNDNQTLINGALYWDTVINGGSLRVRQAGAWVTIPANVASAITTTPAGNLAATNVQTSLAELDAEKAKIGANSDITSLSAIASINGGQLAGLRNRIINGNFGINQRGVSGSVVLAAGAYGHDRFKAGASGCSYTFATAANVTTLTISAGSLQQVIEGVNLESGTYALSWAGTAQGKIGAGAYAASGITGSITGGTNTTIEFGTGTLSKAQLELGAKATAFEQRPYGLELSLCQRYYQALNIPLAIGPLGSNVQFGGSWFTPMRATPAVAASGFTPAATSLGWTATVPPSGSGLITAANAEL